MTMTMLSTLQDQAQNTKEKRGLLPLKLSLDTILFRDHFPHAYFDGRAVIMVGGKLIMIQFLHKSTHVDCKHLAVII